MSIFRLYRVPGLVFGLLLFAKAAVANGNPARIVFPEDKVFTLISDVRVVGRVDSAVPEISLRVVNGGKGNVRIAPVVDGAFTALVSLGSGLNRIELQVGNDKEPADSRRIFFQPQANTAGIPNDFVNYVLHQGDLTEKCADCHVLGRRKKPNYKRLRPVNSCNNGQCHKEIGKAKFVHGPVGGKNCVGCHNPHGSRNKAFVSRTGGDICYNCHVNEEERFRKKAVHFPVAKGECLSCHDPHQSDAKFQLKADPVAKVCSSCHGRLKTGHTFLHGPVGQGDCIACHNPHASENEKLLFEQGNALCFTCHRTRLEQFKKKIFMRR